MKKSGLIYKLSAIVLLFFFTLKPSKILCQVREVQANTIRQDSLSKVFSDNEVDFLLNLKKKNARNLFRQHKLPANLTEWECFRENLYKKVVEKAGIIFNHELPLNIQVTDSIVSDKYSVKNLIFQTRPGVYATANLFVPLGRGPFPGVVIMAGHAPMGRLYNEYIAVARTLVSNGYVSILVDNFGAGERSTPPGEFKYHGGNLGGSLVNIGESLLGFQVSDNMRAVDLLCSLPFVDNAKIGATGASGGGNQTMWLTAIDNRVKAAVPVVSVGTFESYVMGDNCICELLIDGLTFTEEAGILSLVAPRALKMCNHQQDKNPAFHPSSMLTSYNNALPVFTMLGAKNNISYSLFDLPHGYYNEDREAMLDWFNLHLKGKHTPPSMVNRQSDSISASRLMVFPGKKRPPEFTTINSYCLSKGKKLHESMMATKTSNALQKKKELEKILRVSDRPVIKSETIQNLISGVKKIILTTSDSVLVPMLYYPPTGASSRYIIFCDPGGKNNIPEYLIEAAKKAGDGILLMELIGTGEYTSSKANTFDKNRGAFHTLARADMWLGKTIMGEWVNQLYVVEKFVRQKYKAQSIKITGIGEAGLSALFYAATLGNVSELNLYNTPVSYLFDNFPGPPNLSSMAVHVPGFLNWGDVMLASALSNSRINFIHPVTISGNNISKNRIDSLVDEFNQLKNRYRQKGTIKFRQQDVEKDGTYKQ